jgi:hypothetical protein
VGVGACYTVPRSTYTVVRIMLRVFSALNCWIDSVPRALRRAGFWGGRLFCRDLTRVHSMQCSFPMAVAAAVKELRCDATL